MFKTTLADGTTAIDESSGETDAIGLVPASVTFTPSAFTYTEPTFVPHSLIAGAETQLRVTFTIQNPLRIDDKIIFEIPDTFSNVSATAVTPVSGVDGTFLVSQTGAKSVYDNTRKTSGGPWTVTIERAGDGTTVEEDVEVIIDLAHVYNQQVRRVRVMLLSPIHPTIIVFNTYSSSRVQAELSLCSKRL